MKKRCFDVKLFFLNPYLQKARMKELLLPCNLDNRIWFGKTVELKLKVFLYWETRASVVDLPIWETIRNWTKKKRFLSYRTVWKGETFKTLFHEVYFQVVSSRQLLFLFQAPAKGFFTLADSNCLHHFMLRFSLYIQISTLTYKASRELESESEFMSGQGKNHYWKLC